MIASLKSHWPEYLIEAWALATFMISACLATALLEYPSSPMHQAIESAAARRGIIGIAMGLTAAALIYSPWGKRSGAHMNPSVTVTFWRLGKMTRPDALWYILFQFLGGWMGVVISALILGPLIAHPSVAYAITVPGPAGPGVAWLAEFGISFLLMGVILVASNRAELAPWVGILAGSLVAIYILVEAPLSGMSMNAARTLGSAIPAKVYDSLWIYLTAPALGMLSAGELVARWHHVGCAKLMHNSNRRCIFCLDTI
jgi:aquaporin Z